MGKLKPTKKGKGGKHRKQDTFGIIRARSMRQARVVTALELFMIDRIMQGSTCEPEGASVGSREVKLAAKS